MSKISLLFDAIKAAINSEVPGLMQIPDPLKTEQTASHILRFGYSIALGPGIPQERNAVNCAFQFTRDIQIQLTRLIENTENQIDPYEETVKAMFEDQFSLIKKFHQEPTLGGITSNCSYTNDNGLVQLPTVDQVGSYLDLTTSFTVNYTENLNA